MKKIISAALATSLFASALPVLASCSKTPVLRVASWEEYIDEGEDDRNSMIEDFEAWYEEKNGEKIKVEYITLDDNETMYNKIRSGETYDLLCPSEYMIMKLQSEGKLEKYPESFFDTSAEDNYYAKNVSPFIKETFENGKNKDGSSWSEYAAGYMWGTTGFVVKSEYAEAAKSWNVITNSALKNRATAKNNVRDSYFMGLGMLYETELTAKKAEYEAGTIDLAAYRAFLNEKMSDTSADTMAKVKELLLSAKNNQIRFETDDAKDEVIKGDNYDLSYQWSGDAVYIMDLAEEENNVLYDYVIPEASSNLWFDGWVMMNGANTDAATAFVNFISKPENAARNCDYIGYTPCVGGAEMFEYISEKYSAKEGAAEEDTALYDLGYFFGGSDSGNYVLTVPAEQLHRQLFAQFPDAATKDRLAVMSYFDADVNSRANKMWQEVKGA